MTLLDRFRTQPRQKHPDPAVRLGFVAELPLADRQAIAAMAREDEDPRVRRAAVAKLMDPAGLGTIAREDPDAEVRGDAVSMLRDIALEAFEGLGEGDALDAVEALGDPKMAAHIAKNAAREIVALRALGRVTDVHLLGAIGRHGVVEAVRREAIASLRDRGERDEILAIAMNSDYRDSALAALETLTDRADLELIAARGRNKAAAKRARAALREADEREAVVAADAAGAHPIQAGAPPQAPPPSFEPPASDTAEAHVRPEAPVSSVASPAAADEEHRQALNAERVAARTRAQTAGEEAARRLLERRHSRLVEVAAEAAAAAEDADLVSGRRRVGIARREWKDLVAGIDIDPTVAAQFAAADARLTTREAEAREADARSRREALARLHHLLGRVEPLAATPDLSLKAADRALREIRSALGALPALPSKEDFDVVSRRLKGAQAVLTAKVQELREAAEWQRWANVAVQERLCARMEALKALDDPDAIAREVRELQQQWREAADVPRGQADALWRRFKAAHDEVWPRCEAYFAEQARARAENLARKLALCEKAEALAGSTAWLQTAEEIKKLQAEWKTIGPTAGGREKAVWDRFRTACDRFFTRRQQDLVARKAVWSENFAKKDALCVRAEALADSEHWEEAALEVRRLQSEWRTIGPVKKSRSDAIWQRFRSACDRFFVRYAQRHELARTERIAAREAICAELEALAPAGPQSPTGATPEHADGQSAPSSASPHEVPLDLLARVRTIRVRWQQEIALRGVDPEHVRALDRRFTAAFNRVTAGWPTVFGGSDLDPEANRKRMEALVRRIEDLATSIAGPPGAAAADAALSPTTRLAAMLKEALAANTIGGKTDDDSRLRAAADEVRRAQASWSRIGPVGDDSRRLLADRFHLACRRILDKVGAAARSGATSATVPRRSGEGGATGSRR